MTAIPSHVAIFGGTGNLGSATVAALLETGKHKVRVITRKESNAEIPPEVETINGDLEDPKFLNRALAGQDAVVIALGMGVGIETDKKIVAAAAEAGVRYIIPNEFVSQDSLRKRFPFGIHDRKNEIRDLIDAEGISEWIAIVNGTWYDFSLASGNYRIDIPKRKAHIWKPGNVAASVTTVGKVGNCIAALLSLTPDQLGRYTGRCVYVSSFRVSQLDMLHSVQRATNTTDADWEISSEGVEDAVKDGQESAAEGNIGGLLKVIYALQFVPGAGGDYEDKVAELGRELDLKQEDFDVVTRSVVQRLAKAAPHGV